MEKLCSGCSKKGLKRKLAPFQINFNEAVLLCSDEMCKHIPTEGFEIVRMTHSKRKKNLSNDTASDNKTRFGETKPEKGNELSPLGSSCLDNELDEILFGLNEQLNVGSLDLDDLSFLDTIQNVEEKPKSLIPNEAFKYPLWKNENNLCWLHTLMCVIVHNTAIRNFIIGSMANSFLNRLIQGYDECVAMLNSNSSNSNLICHNMEELRDELFSILKPQMNCELGDKENPWFALWALAKIDRFSSIFDFDHQWEVVCQECGYQHVEKKRKYLQTFPAVNEEFSLPNNAFHKVLCIKCKAPGQRRSLKFLTLPSVLAFQFEAGAPHSNIPLYDFESDGKTFKVSAIIQYIKFPAHFITYIRDPTSKKFLDCNDLNATSTSYESCNFDIKSSEIHILIWERVTTATHCAIVKTTGNVNCHLSVTSNQTLSQSNDQRYAQLNDFDNSSSNSIFSEGYLSETASTITNFSSDSNSFVNSFKQIPSSQKNVKIKNANMTKQGCKKLQGKLKKTPSCSSLSETSNASDGDLSIATVMARSKMEGYKGYAPRKNIPKKTVSPKKRHKKSRANKDMVTLNNVEEDASIKDSIASLLNETNFFISMSR